jgi:archaellum biogenesis ATPase FlaH
MRLDNYLDGVDPGRQLVVCFDSVTQALQFSDVQSVFEFLHTFTGRLREVGAVGHFHLDPEAHDPQTVSRLKPAFDDAVDLT